MAFIAWTLFLLCCSVCFALYVEAEMPSTHNKHRCGNTPNLPWLSDQAYQEAKPRLSKPTPTAARPGTWLKVEIMAARVLAHQEIFAEGDWRDED